MRSTKCYSRLAVAVDELATTCRQGGSDQECSEKIRTLNEVSTTARIFVAPTVRTLLSTFANKLNSAAPDRAEMARIADRYWLAILDVSREDLFGEAREMTNEEALA